jgi:N-acylglucosamine 2-epimerase
MDAMTTATKPTDGHVPISRLTELRQQYRAMLFENVVPWWEKHSLDRECGGYFSCLDRIGKPWATDKYSWMTGREIWMFSHLYNHHQPNPAWLDAARLGAHFALKHAFLPEGKMFFRLTRDGRPLSKVLSVYSELFTAIGLAELSRAAQDESLWAKALAMYDFCVPRFGQPSDTPLLGYPIDAAFHLHAHDMCRITIAWVFNAIRPAQRFEDDLTVSAKSIVGRHWKPELNALLENVAMDGSTMLDLSEGRMFHPGHAIESAWMLLEIARKRNDQELVETAVKIITASLEHGWDQEYGGLRYITNIDWSPTHSLEANLKLWWPHCETLYALLLGWSLTGRQDLWQWYERVHEYAFRHFPDPEYGEWYGYLDRDGRPVWTAKATAWKCCFHLPRVLFRCYQLLEGLLKK